VDAVVAACPSVASGPPVPLVVCTGGEPLLQLDGPLIAEFHARRFEVAIETSGSIKVPPGVDWVCVSPKAGVPLAVTEGHELKLAYPQDGLDPAGFERLRFQHFFLQPIDGPDRARNTAQALEYCLSRPRWRLSLQVQKILGIR
jgi:7-carboxy-7-deazaguanine synthase